MVTVLTTTPTTIACQNPAVFLWLTYLTLSLAAGIMIGDVTGIVYNLLGGEMTTRFGLKVVTVGAIAGSVFGYFRRDLHKEEVAE